MAKRVGMPVADTASVQSPALQGREWMGMRTYFLLILFIGLYLAAAVREFALHMNVSDDTLWYYYIGSGVTQPSSFDRERDFLPIAKDLAEDEITWQRLYLRAGYTGNYLIPTLVCFHVGNAIADGASPQTPFIERLSAALYWGYLSALVLGAAVTAFAFVWVGRSLQLPLVVALALIAALDLLPVDGGLGVLSSSTNSLREVIAIAHRLALIFIDPHYAIAPFGAMARNQIIFLALAVYALRWSSKPTAAYAFMIVLLLFHQSMAFLLLASLLAIDIVMRAQIFREPRCAVAAGAALAIGLLREAHWAGIGRAGWIVLAAAAVIALVAIGLVVFALRKRGAGRPMARGAHGRWLDAWHQKGDMATDVIGLSTLFMVALIVAAIANEFAQPFSQQYFWAILPGRLFALLRPLYFLAAAVWLGGWLAGHSSPLGRTVMASVGLVIFVALLSVEVHLTPPLAAVRERMANSLSKLDASLGRRSDVFKIEDEARFYYALVKYLNTRNDYLRNMWPLNSRNGNTSAPAPAGDKVGKHPPAR